MPTYKTQAIILKIKDLGEFDQLITFYTKDFGKLTAAAKSTKKPTAKLKEQLALFNLGQVKIAQGKTIDKLATIFVTEYFLNIKSSLIKTAAGFIILEIMEKLISGQQKDHKLWQLLLGTLQYLENVKSEISEPQKRPSPTYTSPSLTGRGRKLPWRVLTTKKIQIGLAIFQINMLKILGFEPNLHQCVLCQKKLQPPVNGFSLKQGGILCRRCFKNTSQTTLPLATTTIKLWRFLTSQSLKSLPPIKISPAILNQLNQVLINFLQYTSSQQLRSWLFYRKIIQSSTN